MKKFRLEHNAFLVEGLKSVLELLKSSIDISFLVATQSCLDKNTEIYNQASIPLFLAKVSDIEGSGSLKTNNSILAVAKIPPNELILPDKENFVIALDEVRDPGNLGTIIRSADWYGMGGIVLSRSCVDPYNPKTINASMGSFSRVKIFQTDLVEYLAKANVQKLAATMDGKNVHEMKIDPPAIIVMGSESQGLNPPVLELVDEKIGIPRFGGAESLNVAMAVSIICDNLRR